MEVSWWSRSVASECGTPTSRSLYSPKITIGPNRCRNREGVSKEAGRRRENFACMGYVRYSSRRTKDALAKDRTITEMEKEIKENFLKSTIFNWLIARIKKSENQEIYFGSLSSIIHDSLLDDPKPYRQDVKKLQANLYSFLKYYKPNNIVLDIPKTRSERIQLV